MNAGLVVKKLAPMELDSAQTRQAIKEKRTLSIALMVTVGIDLSGHYRAVTTELGLTKRKAFGFEDDTQWLAVGGEFDLFQYTQPRDGARHDFGAFYSGG